jgi:hypothetical protein
MHGAHVASHLSICALACGGACTPRVWVHLLSMQEAREGQFITGDQMTHGDLAVFCQLGWLASGWIKGEQ